MPGRQGEGGQEQGACSEVVTPSTDSQGEVEEGPRRGLWGACDRGEVGHSSNTNAGLRWTSSVSC